MNNRPEAKIRTVTLTALLMTLLVVPPPAAALAPEATEPPPDIVVEVNGLSCPFCAYGIEKKFVERPEVDSIVVELAENEVHLWLKSGEELSDEAVRRTVEEAGFTPGEIRRPEQAGAR
ncbi:MAG: heavy metal-associated domain-containing protein [Gemmatimonadota bacterium]